MRIHLRPRREPAWSPSNSPARVREETLNQAPPFPEANLFELDLALQEGLARAGVDWGVPRVRDIGALAGSGEAREHARRAELHPPRLHTHDAVGNRIDDVECDPSWHLAAGRRRRARHLVAAMDRTATRRPRGASGNGLPVGSN